MRRLTLVSGLGTFLEWSEFTFYAYMVVTIAPLFFPNLSHSAAVMAGFGTFAVSYLARPIGGWFFGYWGDRYGRRFALLMSLGVMGAATFLIGCLPGYARLAWVAPILLVILRLLQGFSVSGEFTGAAVYILEQRSIKRPYLASSWVATASAAGMLAGAVCAAVVSLAVMPSWAWRVPFWVGGVLCFAALWMRRSLPESDLLGDKERQQAVAVSMLWVVRHYAGSIMRVMLLAIFVGVYIYLCNVWWVSAAIQSGLSSAVARSWGMFGEGCVVVLTPLCALLAGHCGSRRLRGVGLLGAAITASALFSLVVMQSFWWLLLAQLGYALSNALVTSTLFYDFANWFPVEVRCRAQAVSWNVAVAIFGGTAPVLASYWWMQDHHVAPVIYVVVVAVLAFVATVWRPGTVRYYDSEMAA